MVALYNYVRVLSQYNTNTSRAVPDFLGAQYEIRYGDLIHTQIYIIIQILPNISRIKIIMDCFKVYKITNVKYSQKHLLVIWYH
jgi:hypothetical protein